MNFEKERRLGDRKKTHIAASIIGQDGAIGEVRLVDISPTGARVSIPAEMVLTKHFKLLLGRVKIEKIAELVWRNAAQAGIRFLSDEEIDRLDAAAINFEKARRLEQREKTQITASLFSQDGEVPDVKLIDISQTGARLEVSSETGLSKQFKMLLGRSKIEKYAELVWRTTTEAGVRFLGDGEIAKLKKPATSRAKVALADLRKLAGLSESHPADDEPLLNRSA